MSDRARVVGIFATVGVLAAGGGYYFFGIYRPAQVKHDAQAEIASWEQRWTAARSCLLGPEPASAKTSEALAVHEMSPDPWDRGSCTQLISKLSRGDAPNTGLPDVERAWEALDKSASTAANAYASHVAMHARLASDRLPGALDALDAARAQLRAAADLPKPTAGGQALPPAQLVAIAEGAASLVGLALTNVPSAHGVVAFGRSSEGDVQVVLRPGQAPVVARVQPGQLRAVPDASWGAQPGDGKIQVGAIDATGAMTAPMEVALPGAQLAGVVGTLAQGLVIYGNENKLEVARTAGGKVAADPAIDVDAALVQTDADGRAVLAWTTPQHSHFARMVAPAGDGPPMPLPAPPNDASCLSADRAWITSNGTTIMAIGGDKPILTYPQGAAASGENLGALAGCTTDGAVIRSMANPRQVLVCTDTCRPAGLPPGAPDSAAVALVGGKLVAIAANGQVVGVWRSGEKPRFFALPEPAVPLPERQGPPLALGDGKVIDLVATLRHGYAIIRLPAS